MSDQMNRLLNDNDLVAKLRATHAADVMGLLVIREAADYIEQLTQERDEAREYGKRARIRENAAEDARINAVDTLAAAEVRAEAAEAELARVGKALEECRRIAKDADTYKGGGHLSLEEVCMGAVSDIAEIATAALAPANPETVAE